MSKANNIKPGEIHWVDFGKGSKCVQGGIRPAIIIQNDKGCVYSPIARVIPLTSQTEKATHLPVHVSVPKSKRNGLETDSVALAEQERGVLQDDIKEYIGNLEEDIQWKCSVALLANSYNIHPPAIKNIIKQLQYA